MTPPDQTRKRKDDHIRIVLTQNVSHGKKTTGLEDVHIDGFEEVELNYATLPEMDIADIDLHTSFLNKPLSAPLLVSGMVGGTPKAETINRDVAKAAQAIGLGMGVGSQRAMIENPDIAHTFAVRDIAPDIFLAGNIGVYQLKKYSIEQLEEMIATIGADALAIHLNAAQEAVQQEGDTDFSDCLDRINDVSRQLSKPVYVKEVGHGISFDTAKALSKTKIAAIDVQGVGGTSWTAVEGLRGNPQIGKTFWNFGIPTAVSIVACRKAFKGPIIASGGIRNGLDIVKSLVLGADIASMATPALQAQSQQADAGVQQRLQTVIKEIRIAAYLIGARNVADIKRQKPVLLGKTRDWVQQLLKK